MIFLFLVLSQFGFAAEMELHGYMRAGTGTNGKGAKQECIYNYGSPSNEMRLGNECSIYGETALLVPLQKSEGEKPWFNTQVRFAYAPAGNSSWENASSGGQNINVVEAFVEAGNVNGSPLTYWAGKRFYRDVDLYIFDWYYYAQMNGNGAGVGNIPLGKAKFAAAYLQETGSTNTNLGYNAAQILDFRLSDLPLNEKNSLHFWTALGASPGGQNFSSGTRYAANKGWLAAARWRHNLPEGFNDFALHYGYGLMEGLNMYGNSILAGDQLGQKKAYRTRLVEHLSWQPWSKLAFHFGSALEYWDPKKSNIDSRGMWWAVGLRPIYFFDDYWQLALEAGHSEIQIRSDRSSSGANIPIRSLNRVSIAPQLALGKSLWARPVLRAFYAYSFWNEPNRNYVAINAPSVANATHAQSIGVQTEVWF